jgi:hypothetical protein
MFSDPSCGFAKVETNEKLSLISISSPLDQIYDSWQIHTGKDSTPLKNMKVSWDYHSQYEK